VVFGGVFLDTVRSCSIMCFEPESFRKRMGSHSAEFEETRVAYHSRMLSTLDPLTLQLSMAPSSCTYVTLLNGFLVVVQRAATHRVSRAVVRCGVGYLLHTLESVGGVWWGVFRYCAIL
jgi:hypothetical protein